MMWHQHKFPRQRIATRHEMNQIIYERKVLGVFPCSAQQSRNLICRAGLISVTLLHSFLLFWQYLSGRQNKRKWQFLVCRLYYPVFQLPGRMLLRNMHLRAGELMSAAFFFFHMTHTHIRKEQLCWANECLSSSLFQVLYNFGYVM
jgi:hypothetical protein